MVPLLGHHPDVRLDLFGTLVVSHGVNLEGQLQTWSRQC